VEVVDHDGSHLYTEAGLANAGRTDEGKQAYFGAAEQSANSFYLSLSPNERSRL
jgi:hypothetical protein